MVIWPEKDQVLWVNIPVWWVKKRKKGRESDRPGHALARQNLKFVGNLTNDWQLFAGLIGIIYSVCELMHKSSFWYPAESQGYMWSFLMGGTLLRIGPSPMESVKRPTKDSNNQFHSKRKASYLTKPASLLNLFTWRNKSTQTLSCLSWPDISAVYVRLCFQVAQCEILY